MSQVILEINHLKKSFGANQVLKDISLTVHKGELFPLSGLPALENLPSCDPLTCWKNQQAAKSSSMDRMSWKKAMI